MTTRARFPLGSIAPSLLGLVLWACGSDSSSAECPELPLYDNRTTSLHAALTDAGLIAQPTSNKILGYQADALARDPDLTDEEALDEAQRRATCEYLHAYDDPFSPGSGCVELPPLYCP